MLEKSDEDEGDENFELYLSDDEKIEDLLSNHELPDKNSDSILFTLEKLSEPSSLQITEKVLIHDPPKSSNTNPQPNCKK